MSEREVNLRLPVDAVPLVASLRDEVNAALVAISERAADYRFDLRSVEDLVAFHNRQPWGPSLEETVLEWSEVEGLLKAVIRHYVKRHHPKVAMDLVDPDPDPDPSDW